MQPDRIAAVIVTYHADEEALARNLRVLLGLGVKPIVFENAPELDVHNGLKDGVHRMTEGRNIGLSAAYNRALEYARGLPGCEAVLFLDQDSIVSEPSLRHLLDSYFTLKPQLRLGVLGGRPVRSDGRAYRTLQPKSAKGVPEGYLPVGVVSSSFSIVPLEVFATVGAFYDDFFIDHVDMDFCARCIRRGYEVLMDPGATFEHRIGEADIRFLGLYLFPLSKPSRHYTQVRNIILSGARQGVSRTRVVRELVRRFAVIGASCLWGGAVLERWRFAFRGLRDGLLGAGTPIPDRKE